MAMDAFGDLNEFSQFVQEQLGQDEADLSLEEQMVRYRAHQQSLVGAATHGVRGPKVLAIQPS